MAFIMDITPEPHGKALRKVLQKISNAGGKLLPLALGEHHGDSDHGHTRQSPAHQQCGNWAGQEGVPGRGTGGAGAGPAMILEAGS